MFQQSKAMHDFFHSISRQVLSTRLPEHIRCFASSVAAKGILPLPLYNFLFLLYQHKFRDISDDASGL